MKVSTSAGVDEEVGNNSSNGNDNNMNDTENDKTEHTNYFIDFDEAGTNSAHGSLRYSQQITVLSKQMKASV